MQTCPALEIVHSMDGLVVRASASGAVNSGLIPSRKKTKLASLLVVPLGKTPSGIPHLDVVDACKINVSSL